MADTLPMGVQLLPWTFGFGQSSSCRRTRALRHPPCCASTTLPLSAHAIVPSVFRVQVGAVAQEPPSQFLLAVPGIRWCVTRRTRKLQPRATEEGVGSGNA